LLCIYMSHSLVLSREVVLVGLASCLVDQSRLDCVVHMQPGNSCMLGIYVLLLTYKVIIEGGLPLLLRLLVHLLLVKSQLLVT